MCWGRNENRDLTEEQVTTPEHERQTWELQKSAEAEELEEVDPQKRELVHS